MSDLDIIRSIQVDEPVVKIPERHYENIDRDDVIPFSFLLEFLTATDCVVYEYETLDHIVYP